MRKLRGSQFFQYCLFKASLFHLSPCFFFMKSSHLVGGLPLDLLIFLGYQSIILDVHRLSFILATYPAHLILLRRVSRTMSCTPDIPLIVSFLISSLMEIFNILLSIALSATASLLHIPSKKYWVVMRNSFEFCSAGILAFLPILILQRWRRKCVVANGWMKCMRNSPSWHYWRAVGHRHRDGPLFPFFIERLMFYLRALKLCHCFWGFWEASRIFLFGADSKLLFLVFFRVFCF